MPIIKKQTLAIASLAIGLAFLSACGGGADSVGPKASITKVYVMGDSLADVGTFGLKFTVQKSGDAKGYPIWPQLIANAVNVDGSAQCNHYTATGTDAFVFSAATGCTNFAIGGGVITGAVGGATNPKTLNTQLTRSAAVVGSYSSKDLILIDGGANDAAALVTAYLTYMGAGGADGGNYQAFLNQLAPLPGAPGLDTTTAPTLAYLYMQKLATTFYGQIKAQTLDVGATRVAVLNMPDITLTPKFKTVLASLGANGPAVQSAVRLWIGAFNAQLKTSIGSDSRVALVDFYADFSDEVANPASFSLVNVTTPVCTLGANAIATFSACSDTGLDGAAGKTAGWWKAYAFADDFHPTPYGHQLLTASVARALARAGWL